MAATTLTVRVSFEYQGYVDYWSGNGRRWDDDAGCLFASLHRGITVAEVVDQLLADFAFSGEFDHELWNDITPSHIESAVRDLVGDESIDGSRLSGCDDYPATTDEDDLAEAPVLIVLLEIDPDEIESHNSDILIDYFRKVEEWQDEYTQSDDYCAEYTYLVGENPHRVVDSLRRLLKPSAYHCSDWEIDCLFGDTSLKEWPNDLTHVQFERVRLLVDRIAERILDDNLLEWIVCDEYSSESNGYIDSFPIGETEDQIDLDNVLEEVADKLIGEPIDVIEDWCESQREFCIHLWRPLREQKYPTIDVVCYSGRRIDYVVDPDVLRDVVRDCVIDYCRSKDSKRA